MRSLLAIILPPQASETAPMHDGIFWFITISGIIATILISCVVMYFAVVYRRGNKVNRRLPEAEGMTLELTWTLIPLVIFLGMFFWSLNVYMTMITAPKDAMNVYVVGKQWMWKMQHPNGKWEMNELHVPLGKAVKLTMISEDVVHDFFIPAFRIKMDVVPGRYTHLWFRPTKPGRYHIFCAQYCGVNHAIMGGYVTVMQPDDYEKWARAGSTSATVASAGEKKFRELGCTGCHGENANVRAPSLVGIFGKPRPIQDANGGTRTVIADQRYIHDAIVLPEREIAAGFQPLMPSYKGRVTEQEILQITEYIKSLGTSNGASNGSAQSYDAANRAARADGSTPAVPTMAKSSGRERVLAEGEQGINRAGVATMAKSSGREAIFRGGANRGSGGTTDMSAGGMRSNLGDRSGGQAVNTNPNYTREAARVYSGGASASNQAYGITMPRRSAQPSEPTVRDASNVREQERTGQ